jgi:hypothetical protein
VTHYVITEVNRDLALLYSDGTSSNIRLPVGNYSINDLIAFLNTNIDPRVSVKYVEQTNTIQFESQLIDVVVGQGTTCSVLLGLNPGMSSVDGVLVSEGIDLRGTPSYFIDSNLRTGNRGPIDRRFGGILAKVPITKPQNGIEFYTGSVVFVH